MQSSTTEQARIEYLPLQDLVRFPRNPKLHDMEQLHLSFNRFGFRAPIMVDEKSGKMVAGHGRLDTLERMKQQGEIAPEGIQVNGENWLVPVIRGLSFKDEKEAEAYLLADNMLTISMGFDSKLLEVILPEHQYNVNGLGFSKEELAKYLPEFRTVELEKQEPPKPLFRLLVELDTEQAQAELCKRLTEEGFKCHPMNSTQELK